MEKQIILFALTQLHWNLEPEILEALQIKIGKKIPVTEMESIIESMIGSISRQKENEK